MARKFAFRNSRRMNRDQRSINDGGSLPHQQHDKDGRFLSYAVKTAVVVTVTRQQLRHQARMAAKAGGAA